MSGSLLPGRSDTMGLATSPVIEAGLGRPGPAAVPPEPAANPIARLIAACRRFAWLIVLLTAIGTVGSIVATRFITPVYSVNGTMWIESGMGQRGPIQAPGLLNSFSWDELLKTYTVLDPVVEQMKLYLSPGKGAREEMFEGFELAGRFAPGEYNLQVNDAGSDFAIKNASGMIVSAGRVTDSVGRELGFKWLPGPQHLKAKTKFAFSVTTPRDASQQLLDRLNIKTSLEGTFLTMSLTGSKPKQLAETMNALQTQFVNVAADLKKRKLTELTKLLGEQERQQEAKLRGAEQALESFRVATITQPREDGGPIVPGLQSTTGSAYGRYFQQRVNLETIRYDRQAIEDVLSRLESGGVTVDAFILIPAVRAAPDLQKVLQELSAADATLRGLDHPDVCPGTGPSAPDRGEQDRGGHRLLGPGPQGHPGPRDHRSAAAEPEGRRAGALQQPAEPV
jgi:hypothetical protein